MTKYQVLKPFRNGAEMVKKGDIIELLPYQARQRGDYVVKYKAPVVKETKTIIEDKDNG